MRFERIGNYRIEREVGTNGSAIVLAGEHLVLPRRATIKVLHEAVASHQQHKVAMLREACILEALAIPGVPKVFDSGVLPDGRPWFAIERIEGETLADRLIANGPMTVGDVAMMLHDLAVILEHAHRRGIVHRSLRPDRIGMAPLAIIDWSEARTHDAAARIPSMLPPGARAFVAPELSRGDVADDRADIYALGVIAYQALTGAFPNGLSIAERCPTLVRELADLVDQMIAVDRYDRPSATEVVETIAELAEILVELRTPAQQVSALRIRKPRWTPAYGVTLPVARIAIASAYKKS